MLSLKTSNSNNRLVTKGYTRAPPTLYLGIVPRFNMGVMTICTEQAIGFLLLVLYGEMELYCAVTNT